MKQILRWGVLATALMVLTGVNARAQGPSTMPATKVGVVNIGLLFTKYDKAQLMKKELENDLMPLKAEAEKIKAVMKQHQEWLEKFGKDPAQMPQTEKSTKAMRDGQRALEDLDMQARKLIGKKQETQLIQLYKEIHSAVQMHAQQNGYHMIFAYGDPPDQDPFTFQNINRKMGGMDMGAAVPYYVQTGLDISNDVLARLNPNRVGGGGVPNGGVTPVGFQK
ncbi:MAG: OmpH family outer membrane protein [Planctomycetota bacterium]